MGGSLVADLRPEQTFSMGESTWLKARCWLGPLPQRWIVIRKAECPRSTLLTKAWSPASPEEGGDVTAVHQQLATGLRPESTDRHGAGDFRYVVRYVRMGPHHQGLRPVHGSRVPGFAGKRAGMWAPYNQQLGNRLRRNRPIGTGRGHSLCDPSCWPRAPSPWLRPVHGSGVPGFAGKRAGMWAPYSNNWATR